MAKELIPIEQPYSSPQLKKHIKNAEALATISYEDIHAHIMNKANKSLEELLVDDFLKARANDDATLVLNYHKMFMDKMAVKKSKVSHTHQSSGVNTSFIQVQHTQMEAV